QRSLEQAAREPRQSLSFDPFEVSSASWTDAETPGDPPSETASAGPTTHVESLLGIAERPPSTHDRAELLHMIVEETKVTLRADYVTIRILEGNFLPVSAYAGMDAELAARLPVFGREESWFGEVLRTGRPVALRDARQARIGDAVERYNGIIEFAGGLISPLIRHDRVIGALAAVT